jgi:excisionase family DNA binding protein
MLATLSIGKIGVYSESCAIILEKNMVRKPSQIATTDTNSIPAVPIIPPSCEVLTVQEAAALLKVPPSSIYEWTRYRGNNRGASLPHRKVGKYLRFLRSEVESWLLGLPQSTNTRKRKYTRKKQAA